MILRHPIFLQLFVLSKNMYSGSPVGRCITALERNKSQHDPLCVKELTQGMRVVFALEEITHTETNRYPNIANTQEATRWTTLLRMRVCVGSCALCTLGGPVAEAALALRDGNEAWRLLSCRSVRARGEEDCDTVVRLDIGRPVHAS
ncbi:hypothetical protein ElyMa_004564500 [Elysia marginata]|uniref:Secreted protein n=1 Tax=Elysia marginata TaxID=1093978 RepID=A0AAV4HSS9_9GAST|nr:hypothetical protein ElyMa_004564500 [Elysia marginata]